MEMLADLRDLAQDGEDDWSAIWAASGAATLSGRADGAPLDVPQSMVRLADAVTARIAAITQRLGRVVELDGPALLGERAALMDLTRRGDVSCGGATRLLRAADGWIAVSLARESDVAAIPAWLEVSDSDELVRGVGARRVADLIERGVLLGMPVAGLCERIGAAAGTPSMADAMRLGACPPSNSVGDLVVVDLSALWAGPLCANVLGLAGARVIKVESGSRPDGARLGSVPFFDLLHCGHESVALDFANTGDVGLLRRLIERADVVIESSRPRALHQLGIFAERLDGPRVWLSITGHGRGEADAMRVGFGDDAAVAGGLVTTDEQGPCFCVDAVTDPLSGMVAAAAVLTALERGDRWLIDVALARTAAVAAGGTLTGIDGLPLAAPRARIVRSTAAPLGRHTDEIVAEFATRRRGVDRS